ncbi:unnamed protein product [Haemonchus placei]|uniref:GLOBIN domain-containing protein n=1 Tax=Haemonchus placei TaxID=6290 RepID=A0A0N4WDV2_HAEPC|nr:unnamed protein product [Haemonchus placei]
MHILADTFDDCKLAPVADVQVEGGSTELVVIMVKSNLQEATFRAYARETINRHRQYKMTPDLWSAFFDVFVNFLQSRGKLTDEQKAAWKQVGEVFNEECQKHLKALGLPHV